MPREITDQAAVIEAVGKLEIIAELLEEQNGKKKYATDLEVIVHGRDYGNGKKVGPYVRLLVYGPGEAIMRQGEWGGNTFYIAVDGSLDVFIDRKSTRLNSSHQIISYAVFCLKKKKTNEMVDHPMRRTQSASQQLSGARAVSRTAT